MPGALIVVCIYDTQTVLLNITPSNIFQSRWLFLNAQALMRQQHRV